MEHQDQDNNEIDVFAEEFAQPRKPSRKAQQYALAVALLTATQADARAVVSPANAPRIETIVQASYAPTIAEVLRNLR